MKYTTISFFLLIITISSSAQVLLYNTDLSKPDSNILFFAKNHLKLSIKLDLKSLEIRTQKSRVTIEDDYLVITPTSLGTDTINILKANKLIVSKIYTIQKYLFPFAQLAYSKDSIITIKKILLNPRLNLVCLHNIKSNIVAYTCIIIKKNESDKPYNFGIVNGFWLTQDIIYMIKTLKAGDIIKFDKIQVLGSDTRGLLLKPFSINIR
jgi:hypothetical protein